jgi:putative ABC transport system permease protein
VLIVIVTALIAVCIVFIAANTASMTVRERMREIAILKAIGFSRRRIFGMLVAEATLLATFAGALGGAASLGLSRLARARLGRLEPRARPPLVVYRHQHDPGRGTIPRIFHRVHFGRRALAGRSPPRRRGDAARSILTLVR